MARIRTFKPEFWTDSKVVTLSPFARLLFLGSWNFALCDDGHLPDDAMALKLQVLPADAVDPFELLQELLDAGVIVHGTTSDGRNYLHIRRLRNHQKVDNRWSPRCFVCSDKPAETPPSSSKLPETRASLDETRRDSPKLPETRPGMERNGKESTSARTRKTRAPETFEIDDKLREWARSKGVRVNLETETEAFLDHHRAKGSTMADWRSAWQTWMRNSVKFSQPKLRAVSGSDYVWPDEVPEWERY